MLNKYIRSALALSAAVMVALSTGCANIGSGKRIVRISHGQSEEHPDHKGLLAFEQYVEDRLGDKYDVQIYPNELLGSTVKAIELVQTGAIDYAVASTGNLESFDNIYQIFSIPYLFESEEVYHSVMDSDEITSIYNSTTESGFEAVTWLDAGTRNFYAATPIRTPEDLKGKKIRVQQSATNVKMMEAFGAAAAPMSFGEVYTAIQQHVIDGAENNELALTNNKHGEVAKYYSYNRHQMVPDMLIANHRFLSELSEDERAVFDEAARECNRVEREQWSKAVEEAKQTAEAMGVEFIDVDTSAFSDKVKELRLEIVAENERLRDMFEFIESENERLGGENNG
jgi:tripartite ATP-independent transporter DctP family solute receptor